MALLTVQNKNNIRKKKSYNTNDKEKMNQHKNK